MGRCLSVSCMRRPSSNIPTSKTAVYCKQHSERGMIDVRNRRCSHSSCTRQPKIRVVVAKKALYCKGHAKKGMVDILTRRCAHESCTTKPSLGVRGSKKAVYCKQHTTKGMADVSNKRCSHEYCVRWPRWGVLPDAPPSTCGHHKSDVTTGRVVDYRQQCNIVGCRLLSRWGFEGKQPTHCPDHGCLIKGLVRTVWADRRETGLSSSSYLAVLETPSDVKAECLYQKF